MRPFAAALEDVRMALAGRVALSERVALASAVGRVAASAVHLDHDVPPFRRAAMDGYALPAGAARVGAVLPVVGASAAGAAPGGTLEAHCAWRAMTGAPVPLGTERVVPFEWTDRGHERVRIERLPAEAPDHVVEAGAHARRGETVVEAGRRLSPADLAALAVAGAAEVEVHVRPRAVVLGTGDELVPVGERPGPGRLRNSNGPYLAAALAAAGAAVEDAGIAPDADDALVAALGSAVARADLVVTSGAVSQGDHDRVPAALEALGARVLFHGWAVQPGGPLLAALCGEALVLAMPGNPAAVHVAFEFLARPALGVLAGEGWRERRLVPVAWQGGWGRPGPRRRVRPADLVVRDDACLVARERPWRGSNDPFVWRDAAAWVVLLEDEAEPPPRADGTRPARALLLAPPQAEAP